MNKKASFNKLHLIWIIPLVLLLLSPVILIGSYFLFTPYGDSCEAWRFASEEDMNSWYDTNYGENYRGNKLFWQHDCPTGYVCTSEKFNSVKDLSEGHTIDNPAKGTCKSGVGFPI